MKGRPPRRSRAPIPSAQGRVSLDLTAPIGRYGIDKLAAGLIGAAVDDPVGVARRIVREAADQAWHEARRIMQEQDDFEPARAMLERLERMERDCAAIERSDAWLSFWPREDDEEDPIFAQLRAADSLRTAAATFRQAAELFRRENSLGRKPSLGRSRPLERAFVARFRVAWLKEIGRPAPLSRTGPVVEFVRVAWSDAGFPAFSGDDDTLANFMGRAFTS